MAGRIAVFGDVHGNGYALEAVIRDMEAHQPDEWVNLGDQLFGGADPARAWELQQRIREQYAVKEIRGNTDERLGETLTPETKKRGMLEWLHSVLPQGAGHYVTNLPTGATLGGGKVLAGHGTPTDPWEYLLRGSKTWASDELVMQRLGDVGEARVVIVGHSHLEHVRQIGPLTVVNCGAVSRQKDGSPLARWVLLEGEGDLWNVTFRRVAYDVDSAANWAETHAYDGGKEARQLITGKEE
ncbi:metallophosphoesterase family protein [Deinococcus sp.]|uniref:metallophosphoesterase family protein n=1 Tax=Deinococcus sp. TaxID=47478 RepID=UPI0025BF1942|nr:metallophosphoesterase family protein [Deinococcus sp.]